MKTFERVCIEDYIVEYNGSYGIKKTLQRGQIYLTSEPDEKETVTVFTSHWISGIPVEIFAGEKEFTK